MIRLPEYDPGAPIIVVDIGNTSTKVATWHEGALKSVVAAPTGNASAFDEMYRAHQEASSKRPAATIVGSVVPNALTALREYVKSHTDRDALVVGDTLPLPMDVAVKDAKSVGVDRICQAAAAYDRLRATCTIVSFGTAVTVDLVSDEGEFLGGAILPGIEMQFRALHEFTAVLPKVSQSVPLLPFGQTTAEAIQTGVCRGLSGTVRAIVEGYASHFNRWPQVVATGGGAEFMMPLCDFIDTWASDLALRGIALAFEKHLHARGA